MTARSFADLLKEAEDAGLQTWTPESGHYHLEVPTANYKDGKNGTPVFGVRWRVVGGPFDGKSFWDNFRFASPQNTAITLRTLAAFGLDGEFFGSLDGPIPDNADKVIARLKAISADVDLGVKQNGDFTNYSYKVTDAETPAAAPADQVVVGPGSLFTSVLAAEPTPATETAPADDEDF